MNACLYHQVLSTQMEGFPTAMNVGPSERGLGEPRNLLHLASSMSMSICTGISISTRVGSSACPLVGHCRTQRCQAHVATASSCSRFHQACLQILLPRLRRSPVKFSHPWASRPRRCSWRGAWSSCSEFPPMAFESPLTSMWRKQKLVATNAAALLSRNPLTPSHWALEYHTLILLGVPVT